GVTFGVNVGNLLELQSAFQRDWIMDTPAKIKEIGITEELPRQILVEAGFVGLQDHFDFVRYARELLHQFSCSVLVHFAANLSEIRREQKQSGQLRSEGLGGSHADFRAGVSGNRAAG